MANLSGLSTVTTAASALSNLILVSPQSTVGYQPQNSPTNNGTSAQVPPSILFHYEGEQTANLESDITDHFIEDNTAIQDQIALKPVTVTTHGFIGELNDVAIGPLAILQAAANKLGAISAYTPALSTTALIAYTEAFFLYQTAASLVNSAVSAWSSITGGGGEAVVNGNSISNINKATQTRQQQVFAQFFGYWSARTLFTVQTPWAVFENMAIKSLRAIQDAETNVITDFEVVFKSIRTAQTQSAGGLTDLKFQGRSASQAASLTDLGTSTPVASLGVDTSLGSSYPGIFSGVA